MSNVFPQSSSLPGRAQVLIGCPDLSMSIAFFTEQLGMLVDCIHPADSPQVAVLSGHGITLSLTRAQPNDSINNPTLHLLCAREALPNSAARTLISPCGVRIEWVDAEPPLLIPEGRQEFVLVRGSESDAWGVGRAGMRYRDLIPGRLGGRFIASHIRIPEGGPVPDYVHFHRVRLQMIYCKAGWVRVVYEDQGEPFVLQAGDCVLQPPQIRHRVLEASAGLEVIELGCPAIHETHADHGLPLPNNRLLPDRDFSGQRFVRHIANDSAWQPSHLPGWAARDTGIGAATRGLASARVLRPSAVSPGGTATHVRHAGELLFLFVLRGTLALHSDTHGAHTLRANDCCTLPAGADFALRGDAELELLEVTLPAAA